MENPINILWTGGWDSTFRLLQLLLIQKRLIQPYYLIDSDRNSTGMELKTIKAIKERLFNEHPHTKELLLPTQFKAIDDIKPNSAITECFQLILQDKFMGAQYDWLARFAYEAKLEALELSIHKDDKAHEVLEAFVQPVEIAGETIYRCHDDMPTTPEYIVFHYFHFPIFELTKVDMQTLAKQNQFLRYMEMTWFCHSPDPDGTPCGRCNPCLYTIEEGLAWRIPEEKRQPQGLKNKLKAQLAQYPQVYELVHQAKKKGFRLKK